MLAHLSTKDKQSFFNIKPTVIDRLISKNKSSIQNSLLYPNDDTDESVSEGSEESSSSKDSNLIIPISRLAVRMAPVRKKDKVNIVSDKKISPENKLPFKRGRGRPPNPANVKVISAKKSLESKKESPKKTQRAIQTPKKLKKVENKKAKLSAASLKKACFSSNNGNRSIDKNPVSHTKKKKHKPEPTDEIDKCSLRSSFSSPVENVASPNISTRKFPNNLDCWKSVGFLIRGRGSSRGRGASRGSLRGGLKRSIRSERYNTRDSQTGLMRSGKKRKCSDSILVEGLSGIRRKRRSAINHINQEKLDCPSDEQSSFVTTSELSFCENDNSLKQSDEDTLNLGSTRVKVEVDSEDDTSRSRDTNSNVFLANKGDDKINITDRSRISKKNTPRTYGRGRLRRSPLAKVNSDSIVKDSDCSLDSDFTTNPILVAKTPHRYRGGYWVRRSTRSIRKSVIKVEPDDVVEDDGVFKETALSVNLGSSSKSSCRVDTINLTDSSKDLSKKSGTSNAVIQTPTNDSKKNIFVENCKGGHNFDDKSTFNSTNDGVLTMDNDSTSDFSLVLEMSPVNNTDTSELAPFNLPSKKENCQSYPIFNEQNNSDLNNSSKENLDIKASYSDQKDHFLSNFDASHEGQELEKTKVTLCNKNNSEAGVHNNINGLEHVSDENILAMLDSFGTSDVSAEDTQNPVNSGDRNYISTNAQDIIDIKSYKDKISLKLEKQLNNEPSIPESIPPNDRVFDSQSDSNNDEQISSKVDSNFQHTLSETQNTNICTNIVKKIMDERSNETMSQSSSSSRVQDSLNGFDDNTKMDIEIDSAGKAPESSEESSSDTNSNLSELMSNGLETDTVSKQSNVYVTCNEEKVSEADENRQATSSVLEADASPHSSDFPAYQHDLTGRKDGDLKPETKLLGASTGERPSKELLSALGLQSLHTASEDKLKRPNESYTGTLKAVIKLNRSSDKKGRKIIFKQGETFGEEAKKGGDRLEYRICSAEELSTDGVPLTHLNDIPANKKTQVKIKHQFDLSNSPNIVGASGSTGTPSTSEQTKETGGKQNLVIPEKSSSFSIHPERLCTDVCTYCFGKFGSLDTPCHLAQLKNSERQSKILAIEVHLSADSCLCDGCFRYIDRKVNCPASQRSRKPAARRGPLAGTVCAVQDCCQPARHSVRRKWLIKLKKSIGKKLVIDMDKNPHLPFPLCSQHYYWVDYFTVCGICKKRLTRNHMYAVGPEAHELNQALSIDGIPVRLSDNLFLCKLCRYYSSLRLKYRDNSTMSSTHRLFLSSYRKKILHYHDITVSDSEEDRKGVEEDGSTSESLKPKKKKSKSKSLDGHEPKKQDSEKEEKPDLGNEDKSNESQMIDYSYLDTLNVHREGNSASSMDYNELGFTNIASLLNPLEGAQGNGYPSDSQNRPRVEKPTRIQVKFGNLNIGKLSNLNIGQDSRPTNNAPSTSERPPFLPGERELNLAGDLEFHGALNPHSGWERCTSTIQFDRDTKKMWQELQRPYGNQSSFIRHLVILEKYWRNGSLVLSENPNPKAVKYINSVRNRVQAYDGAAFSDIGQMTNPPDVTLFTPPRPMSTPVKTTSAPPPLMKITPGNTPWLSTYQPGTSAPTITTHSRLVPLTAPPPYRVPAPRGIRLHPPFRQQQSIRPVSISYQQFKRIRLEKPAVPASQVIVTAPKTETSTNASSSKDFVPLICDVRSLATSESTDWSESFRQQQQKMLKQNIAKYYTPIIPKVPNSLIVTTFPQSTSLVMKTSSLTIEKADSDSLPKPNIAPPEKPSISVFREPTPGDIS